MLCFDKIMEIFCIVDTFCKDFQKQTCSFLLGNQSRPQLLTFHPAGGLMKDPRTAFMDEYRFSCCLSIYWN
jgi:hypothetical protein